jgi:hypothetical protein
VPSASASAVPGKKIGRRLIETAPKVEESDDRKSLADHPSR